MLLTESSIKVLTTEAVKDIEYCDEQIQSLKVNKKGILKYTFIYHSCNLLTLL